jgi:predicted GIY-YIG superfamily endonuclease
MYYVIVLRDKVSDETFIGRTNNLEQELALLQGKNRNNELIYYEAYKDEKIARNREQRLSSLGSTWRALRERLKIF